MEWEENTNNFTYMVRAQRTLGLKLGVVVGLVEGPIGAVVGAELRPVGIKVTPAGNLYLGMAQVLRSIMHGRDKTFSSDYWHMASSYETIGRVILPRIVNGFQDRTGESRLHDSSDISKR